MAGASPPTTGTAWEDLGRPPSPSSPPSSPERNAIEETLIERNFRLLEFLLSQALQHDRAQHQNDISSPAPADGVLLPPILQEQVRRYVTLVASNYHPVAFHSFEHASHVVLSASKMCSMLRGGGGRQCHDPTSQRDTPNGCNNDRFNFQHHNNASLNDPWLHFAISFATLIHDLDHKGVPNSQLAAEDDPLATRYGDEGCMKSYAEWNSIDIGLEMMEREELNVLREIFDRKVSELSHWGPNGRVDKPVRLCDLVRDLVLCTDIASKERREAGMRRWKETFAPRTCSELSSTCTCSDPGSASATLRCTETARRAVGEQIMQAADVSHTMQNWDTFLKWNKRLYHEMLSAYQNGRTDAVGVNDKHPASNWYSSEIGFFDFYVIPLAERLGGLTCGVFEPEDGAKFALLAKKNRDRWIKEGEEVTRLMIEETEGSILPPPVPRTTVRLASPRGGADMKESIRYNGLCSIDDPVVYSIDGGENEKKHSSNDSLTRQSSDGSIGPTVPSSTSSDDAETPLNDTSISSDNTSTGGDSGKAVHDLSVASDNEHDALTIGSVFLVDGYPELSLARNVDATVPRILVKQILDSIHHQSSSHLASSLVQDRERAIKTAVRNYHNTGSMLRYNGSVLFVDISGFTNLAQNYPLEDFKNFINEYFTKLIDLIVAFGGEVVKFAGDALYAIWLDDNGGDNDGVSDPAAADASSRRHSFNVAKCMLCGIAINDSCNNYQVSKSYYFRRRSLVSDDSEGGIGRSGGTQDHVMYSMSDSEAKSDRSEATLNVHCGISEGSMAGINVIAAGRAEFFLIGQPLTDVATAEDLAKSGELVISPSVYECLKEFMALTDDDGVAHGMNDTLSRVTFEAIDGDYYKVIGAKGNISSSDQMLAPLPNEQNPTIWAQECVGDFVSSFLYAAPADVADKNPKDEDEKSNRVSWHDCESLDRSEGDFEWPSDRTTSEECRRLQKDMLELLECHSHEATRDTHEKLSAELRRVVVAFIKIHYEPTISSDASLDEDTLVMFQDIFTIISNCTKQRNGQVRQFMSDDKGTVCIISFGLRGSATLNTAATAVNTAQDMQRQLRDKGINCSIGIASGKVFCGETGSQSRYEYSLLGPTVNLSARMMAKGSLHYRISCDEETRNNDSEHSFNCGTYKLKGYDKPVPYYTPIDEASTMMDQKVCVKPQQPAKLMVRQKEIQELAEYICNQEGDCPSAILVSGQKGTGKTEFITGVLAAIKNTRVVLQANRCYHDSPFYCWIPIITSIVMGSGEVMRRISRMKKKFKRNAIPSSLLSSSTLPTLDRNDHIVPEKLRPYLPLLNDFVYEGFPVFKKTDEVECLKDTEKVEKCLDVLSAAIVLFIERCEKPGLVSIHSIDNADDYSKQLIQRLFNIKCNLVFMGSIKKVPKTAAFDQVDSTSDHFQEIFGPTDKECKEIHLECLSKASICKLFKWSMSSLSDEDRDLLDNPAIAERVHQLCGGIPRFVVDLAHVINLQWKKNLQQIPSSKRERVDYLESLLETVPVAKLEELVCFRFDFLSPEAQMLLKVASVAGFDQYSFSLSLLETLVLSLSKTTPIESDGTEELHVPVSVGNRQEINVMFQGDNFEQIIDSLIDQNYLAEINAEMGDTASLDEQLFRFVNRDEQLIINGLMLDEQKRTTHFEIAQYYKTRLGGQVISGDDEMSDSVFSSDISSIPTLSWQMLHMIALHYDLSGAVVPAMIHYYESGMELARLGVRDRAHGSLISSYFMLERRIHDASLVDTSKFTECVRQRQSLTKQMVRMIGRNDLPESMQLLTREHLKFMFEGDVEAFITCITMLTKFGQSVGTIEKEGYKLGADIYMRAIFFSLLGLKKSTFQSMMMRLSKFLGSIAGKCASISDVDDGEEFCIADLSVSFPAFSGLLTFYRDSPIGADMKQETFLANLFVAFTEETNQPIHMLRTKCILSHLYLKHGDVKSALEVSESIKEAYDHDKHSLELAKTYGMDWTLICIGTMACVYIFRGEMTAALDSIHFLERQIMVLDEFASSTKAMMKQIVSSMYLVLHEYDKAAELVEGIANTPYPYFYKPSGILQEKLSKVFQMLHSNNKALCRNEPNETDEDSVGVLSILAAEDFGTINHNRSMLHASIETLSDRGIEAIQAAICVAEIERLEEYNSKHSLETVQKQMKYCQAGLAHLEQSLLQKDASSNDKMTNYLSCLYQQAELLVWYHKIQLRQKEFGVSATETNNKIEAAISALRKCEDLCIMHDYFFMLLLVGARHVELAVDTPHGEDLLSLALDKIRATRSATDYAHVEKFLTCLRDEMASKEACRDPAIRPT